MKKRIQLFSLIGITLTFSACAQENIPAAEVGRYTSQSVATGQGRFAVNHFHWVKVKPQSDEFWAKYPGTQLSFDNPASLHPPLRPVLVSLGSPRVAITLPPIAETNYSAKAARDLQKLGLTK